MGACQSIQDGDEEEKKKRSRQIDAKLLEDERRLRKECKILLLGMIFCASDWPVIGPLGNHHPLTGSRLRGER